MKLEVGMYVRTKCGIEQIYMIDNNKTKYKYLFKLKKQDGDGCIDCGCLCIEDIIGEPSFEIIDLIQENDFVNGHRVIEVDRESLDIYIENSMYGCGCETINGNTDIKSIVTKEQFEAMAYKVV